MPNIISKKFNFLKFNSTKTSVYLSYYSLSIFTILYTIFSLTIINLQIHPTINRITLSDAVVNWSLTGSQEFDIIITTIIFCTGLIATFKKIISVPISIIIFLIIVISALIGTDNTILLTYITFFFTLPIVITLFLIPKVFFKNNSKNQSLNRLFDRKNFHLDEFLVVFFFLFIIIESVALIRWIIQPLVFNVELNDWAWQINFLDNNLFLAFGLLSPLLILFSVSSFFIKPILLRFRNLFSNIDGVLPEKKLDSDEFQIYKNKMESSSNLKKQKIPLSFNLTSQSQIFLLLCLVAILPAIFLSLYPYLVTPEDQSDAFGGDIIRYQKWLDEYNSLPEDVHSRFIGLFTEIDNGSRPLSLLTIHILSQIINQDEIAILKYLPALLGPLLVFSSYYLTRSLYPESKGIALIVAILTAASHQLVIGIYAAFYANWMSLIVLGISLAFFVKSMKEDSNFFNVILFTTFFCLTLFFHSYTWSFFVAVIAFFLIWSAIQKIKSKENLRIIFILTIALVGVISIDLLRAYFGDVSDSFQNNLTNPSTSVGFDQLTNWWSNLSKTFNIYLGGFLTNSALLLLVFLWSITANYKKISDRLLYSILFVSILPIFFSDFVVQSRIFYDIFLQIPAGILIYKLYKNKKYSFGKPLLAVIILIQFNYALRAMSNMIFIPPTG